MVFKVVKFLNKVVTIFYLFLVRQSNNERWIVVKTFKRVRNKTAKVSAPEPTANVLTCLKGINSNLTLVDRKIRDYILNNIQEASRITIAELAERTYTSQASISRFCRKIGFKNFSDFRLSLAQEATSKVHHIHGAINVEDSVADIISKICAVNVKAIEDTMKILDPNAIKIAAQNIVNATKVKIFAVGGSEAIATDIYHKFLRIGLECHCQVDIRFQQMQAALTKPGDVVLVLSISGAENMLVDLAKTAHKNGATVICVTNGLDSPITEYADVALYGAFRENFHYTGTVETRIAQMYILDCLFVIVSMMTMPNSLDCLGKTTQVLEAARIKKGDS